MLDYSGIATVGMGIATAALDQPGDEGCAYARGKRIGNAETAPTRDRAGEPDRAARRGVLEGA